MPLHLLRRASPIRPVCVTYQQLSMNCSSPLLSEKLKSLERVFSDFANRVGKVPPNSCRASRRFSRNGLLFWLLWSEFFGLRFMEPPVWRIPTIIVITNDNIRYEHKQSNFWLSLGFWHGYSLCRDNEKGVFGVPSFTGSEKRDSGNRE